MEATLDNYKLSCELYGHSQDVRCVAAGANEPDGQIILSASRDKTAKVWKRVGGEYAESLTFQDHKHFVGAVCYLEVERWICTASNDSTVCIYAEGSYVPITILKGHTSAVCSVAGGLQRQSIITGSWDATARIWQIDQMGNVSSIELKGHEMAVWAVATLPQAKNYITGSADKNIMYWNAIGEMLRVLRGHTDCVRSLLIMPDERLVSCGNDEVIRYWNESGEIVKEMRGHKSFIYQLSHNRMLGPDIIVSCSEDSTIRMWSLSTGKELGAPLTLPMPTIWSVACLENGDIVAGGTDGIVRVFTKEESRYANEVVLTAYQVAIETRKNQMNDQLGDIKKDDLPGPETLLSSGNREGQTKMVRHQDGSVKCYIWQGGVWTLIGDVTGAAGGQEERIPGSKITFEGKEYDFVFNVDISDTQPAIKLPYNSGEDPWLVAQNFIHRHNLPQAYLEQVANFIIKSAGSDKIPNAASTTTSSGYQDPFTGASRYIPGASQTTIPSQGRSALAKKVEGKPHFPMTEFLTFDICDTGKILLKLREFNSKLEKQKTPDGILDSVIKLADIRPEIDHTAIEGVNVLLRWPHDMLFPVLDISRLAVRHETIFTLLAGYGFVNTIIPMLKSSPANQLMTVRCFTNMMRHELGRTEVERRLTVLLELIGKISAGNSNLQNAIATFFLNVSTTMTVSPGLASAEKCRALAECIIQLLSWINDLEACYRALQTLGNIVSTSYSQDAISVIAGCKETMEKIRDLSYAIRSDQFVKLNAISTALIDILA